VARVFSHPHPCGFRLARHFDRGWGEAAFEYRWDSTSGVKVDLANPDLDDCRIYELIRYESGTGVDEEGWYLPPDPPFNGWRFRNPTDGRTAPVGLECFPATQGWAWDRHKLLGRLTIPPVRREYVIRAVQEYRFTCAICGEDAIVPDPDSGPHEILRTFTPSTDSTWRYALRKHGTEVWMDIAEPGAAYLDDSAAIGFGPWS
jgi:hypothetical protein